MNAPCVKIINDRRQEFNGEVFYLCGYYFQRKGKRLHRVVWEYHNGPVPKGYHVHHIDGDRSNNNIENLTCITAGDHERQHSQTQERMEYGKMHIERIRPKSVEWHKSEEGLLWHSEQGKQNYRKRKINTYVCTQCSKEFQTKHVYSENSNHFCGNNCRAKYGRTQKTSALGE